MISWEDSAILTEALYQHGFVDIHTADRKDRNFVMGHQLHGRIDFHVVELTKDGDAIYGPGEIDWVITESELSAVGLIGGREVRCLSVDYQVRSHAGYTLQDTDFADMRALQEKFGLSCLLSKLTFGKTVIPYGRPARLETAPTEVGDLPEKVGGGNLSYKSLNASRRA